MPVICHEFTLGMAPRASKFLFDRYYEKVNEVFDQQKVEYHWISPPSISHFIIIPWTLSAANS
jgi:hypothetical protein